MLKLLNVMVVASYCTAQLLYTEINKHVMISCNLLKGICAYFSKSRSHRLSTSSNTDRFRCGKSDESISMAFCETSGVLDVTESGLLLISSFVDCTSIVGDGDDSVFGSVTFMPKIFPGGSDSSDFPVSFDAKRNAIASSTACCRFSAT